MQAIDAEVMLAASERELYADHSSTLFDHWHGNDPSKFEACNFLILKGYIDESYRDDGIFCLSAVMATGFNWLAFERRWEPRMRAANKRMLAAGRKPITRFHAADFSHSIRDFEGWGLDDPTEKVEFMRSLLGVFDSFSEPEIWNIGYSVPLQDYKSVFHDVEMSHHELKGACYSLLFRYLMLEVGITYREASGAGKVALKSIDLFHERCAHDGILLNTFNLMVNDVSFPERHLFKSLAPVGWEDCIPVQAADLLAYENFKESQRLYEQATRQRRKSLTSLNSMGSMAGILQRFDKANLLKLRERLEAMKRTDGTAPTGASPGAPASG